MCQGDSCIAKPTGHKLYEACTPSSDLQADCDANTACIGIGGRGYYCYQKPPCSFTEVSVFGMVCVQPCQSPDMTTVACPVAANYCFANNDTPDEMDGWCIP
jgi:hypothetical protein